MIVTDAKEDTTQGRSKWSSIRCRTSVGISQPISVWISPEQRNQTITLGLEMTAVNMHCHDPTCSHDLVIEQNADGTYRQRRACARWWRPAVMIDKHWPSFLAVGAAGFGPPFLCLWHADKAFDTFMSDAVGILGDVSQPITWAFRIVKRSRSVDQARRLFREFARFVWLRMTTMMKPPWTAEQGEMLADYVERRWMHPLVVLRAWIDADALQQRDFFATGGDAEASHAFWDKYMMQAQKNRLISKVISKTVGVVATGSRTTGFFPNALRRYQDAVGTPAVSSTDVMIRQHKAELVFLLLGPSVLEVVNNCALVPHFNDLDSCLQRHAKGADLRASTLAKGRSPLFPPELQPMLKVLQHGGAESYRHPLKVSVDLQLGSCECLDNVWKGVLGAVPKCKHRCLVQLCQDASESAIAAAEVRDDAAASLRSFVWGREKSKPAHERNKVLYAASQPSVPIEDLLQALKMHTSYPSSGKGSAAVTHGDDSFELEQDDAAAAVEEEEAARFAEETEMLKCTFSNISDLGVIFCEEGEDAVVVRFAQLRSGVAGPAAHSGEPLRPGDRVVAANGVPTVASLISPRGVLEVAQSSSSATLVLTFVRVVGRTTFDLDLGGRPGAKKAKYPSRKQQAESSSGGLAGVKAPKPQRSRAAEKQPSAVKPRSGFEPRRPNESEAAARERVEAAFDALFQRTGPSLLSGDEIGELDGELEAMDYIP